MVHRTKAEDPPRVEDLKRDTSSYESGLKSGEIVKYMGRLESELAQADNNPEAWIQYFVSKTIPKCVNVLCKRTDLATIMPRVIGFLGVILNFATKHISVDECAMMEIIYRLTMKNLFFNRMDSDPEEEDDEMYDTSPTKESSYRRKTKAEELMVHFVKGGLYNVVMEHLHKEGESALPLPAVKWGLKTVYSVMEQVGQSSRMEQVEELREQVYQRLINLTDEELKGEDRKVVYEVATSLSALFSLTNEDRISQVWSDELMLKIAFKYFTSSSLERRLQGLHDIRELTCVQKRMTSKYMTSNDTKMVNWLKDQRIIEHLYGSNLHIQLIKRSGDIISTLIRSSRLDERDLDLIWEASKGHESIAHIIYELVGGMAEMLHSAQLDYLFEKMKEIPYSDYDQPTIHLLYRFTHFAVAQQSQSNVRPRRWYALPIFWEAMQDESGTQQEVKHMSLQYLCQFLNWSECFLERMNYIRACIKNLSESKSVPRCLFLLEVIIKSYSGEPHLQDTAATVITYLNTEMHLLNILLRDLERYKVAARAAVMASHCDPLYIDLTELVGSQTHLDQIKARLGFLAAILSLSDLMLSEEQVDHLWTQLVDGSLTPMERDMTFKWFEDALGNHQSPFFGHDTIEYILTFKFPTLDFSTLTPAGIEMFEYYFRFVNWKHNNFDQTVGDPGLVASFDLVGVENLWRITLEVTDPLVGETATTILIRLYKNLSPELRAHIGQHREAFVKKCMTHMSEVVRSADAQTITAQQEIVIQRCLLMLKMFLEQFETKPSLNLPRHGMRSKKGAMRTVVVRQSNTSFPVQVCTTDTVAQLRQTIAEKMTSVSQLTGIYYRIFRGGKELHDKEDLSWANTENIVVMIHPTQKKVEVDETRSMQADPSTYPSQMIAKPDYFDVLFRVLALGGTPAQLSWELLMQLPTNVQSRSALSELNPSVEPQWESIFNSSSTYALLYSLQIIESLLEDPDDSEEERAKKKQWHRHFLELGGLRYLFSVLIDKDLQSESNGPKRKLCLRALLHVISAFVLQVGEDEETGKKTYTADFDTIRNSAEMTRFIHKLMDVIGECARIAPVKEAEEDTVPSSSCTTLVSSCCLSHPDQVVPVFLSHKSFEQWVTLVLLDCKNAQIRQDVARTIETIASPGEAHLRILSLLLSLLPKLAHDVPTADHYFRLLQILIGRNDEGLNSIDFASLLHQVTESIKSHPIIEARRSKEEDVVLQGLINLARTVLKRLPQAKQEIADGGMVTELFDNCLFNIPTADDHGPLAPPKCKTKSSRKAAFNFLMELTVDCPPVFQEVLHRLQPFHGKANKVHWGYLPSAHEKSETGYVGLRNLGATCYMNSLMQQLYMVPHFRYSLLSVPVEDTLPATDVPVEDKLKENVLYHMQLLLSHLQESEKKYFDTKSFTSSYKFDGQPVDTSVQMDADEFFNMLFDRFETLLKPLKKENVLTDYFGGTVCNQVISKECNHVSERDEHFFTVSLEIKGKRSITESLGLYVQGDLLEGENKYHCSQCDKKVDALKRSCLKKLPDNLIIHAKRFEFDLEQMRRIKVNDYFEFPHQLNMEPYTLDYISKKDKNEAGESNSDAFKYQLAGILVHTGTADGGHYYSFIKERENSSGGQRRWYQFNDTDVDLWDPSLIPTACFGGSEHSTTFEMGKSVLRPYDKMNNAYMLFYERIKPQQVSNARLPPSEEAARVPKALYDRIWEENMHFLSEKNVFDVDYFRFFWDTLSHAATAQVQLRTTEQTPMEDSNATDTLFQCIELGTRFMFVTMIHSKDRTGLRLYIDDLITWYSNHAEARRWFINIISQEADWMRHAFLFCPNSDTREQLVRLIISIITLIVPEDRPYYANIPSQESDDDTQPMDVEEKPTVSLIGAFITRLVDLLPEAPSYWANISQLFLLLLRFAAIGDPEKKMLMSMGFISKLIDFYAEECAPSPPAKRRQKMGDKVTHAPLEHLIQLVSVLVRSGSLDIEVPPNHETESPIMMLEARDRHYATHLKFFEKALSENLNIPALSAIVEFVGWNDLSWTKEIVDTCTSNVNTGNHESIPAYLEMLVSLVKMKDDSMRERVDNIMWGMIRVIMTNLKFTKETVVSIETVVKMAQVSEMTRAYLFSHRKQWMDVWLFAANEGVREITAHLVEELQPGLPRMPRNNVGNVLYVPFEAPSWHDLGGGAESPLTQDEADRVNKTFNSLLELLPVALNFSRIEKAHLEPLDGNTLRCIQYFRLLRWFARSEAELSSFAEFAAHFMRCLSMDNECNAGIDFQKLEMILFLVRMIQHPENLQAILSTEKHWIKLFDFFIKLAPSDAIRRFNAMIMPQFYSVIHTCCVANAEFLKAWLTNTNFKWAFIYVYMDQAVTPEVEKIFHGTLEFAFQSKDMRRALASTLLKSEPNLIMKPPTHPRGVWVLDQILSTEEDLIAFCSGVGIVHLGETLLRVARDAGPELGRETVEWMNIMVRVTRWILNVDMSQELDEVKEGVMGKPMRDLFTLVLVCIREDRNVSAVRSSLISILNMYGDASFRVCVDAAANLVTQTWQTGRRDEALQRKCSEAYLVLVMELLERALTMDAHYNDAKSCRNPSSIAIFICYSCNHYPQLFLQGVRLLLAWFKKSENLHSSQDMIRLSVGMVSEKSVHSEDLRDFLAQVLPVLLPRWDANQRNSVIQRFKSNVQPMLEVLEMDSDASLLHELQLELEITLLTLDSDAVKEQFMEKTTQIFECINGLLPSEGTEDIRKTIRAYHPAQ